MAWLSTESDLEMVYTWTKYSFKGNTYHKIPTYIYLLQMMIGKS